MGDKSIEDALDQGIVLSKQRGLIVRASGQRYGLTDRFYRLYSDSLKELKEKEIEKTMDLDTYTIILTILRTGSASKDEIFYMTTCLSAIQDCENERNTIH